MQMNGREEWSIGRKTKTKSNPDSSVFWTKERNWARYPIFAQGLILPLDSRFSQRLG